jgi:hypothetical protein
MDGSLGFKPRRDPPPGDAENKITPLTRALLNLAVRECRDPLLAEMSSGEYFPMRALNAWAYALIGRGRVLAAAGLIPMWSGRAEAWLIVGREASPRDLVPALRQAGIMMDHRQRLPFFRRIEAYVRCEEAYAPAFIAALGMEIEGVMRAWDPLGRDYYLCARVAR